MMISTETERLGVSKLEYFFSANGWLFREQFLHDYGIDAHVEIVDGDQPTGKLIAIQIKSGQSYFSETTKYSIIFRTDNRHIEYWIAHSLPVIVVLYDPVKEMLYWEEVSESSYKNTGKGWKIDIPKNKILTDESLIELYNLTQPPSYIQKLNKLRLDKTWIDIVANGESVYVEFEDWVHKSLPRFKIKIGCGTRHDIEIQEWPTIYGAGLSIEESLSYTIPWADFELDVDAHRDYMESIWDAECYMGRDSDDGSVYHSESFDSWYEEPTENIVPVSDNGETEGYRLYLSLNKIGKSFLELNNFLEEERDTDNKIFRLR
jgi:uncharacterized protein DUF4365